MRVIRITSFLASLLFVLINTAVFAEELPDYSKGLLDQEQVIKAASAVSSERFPNSDYVLVDDHILVKYEEDGTYVEWDDTYLKILTEKGKRNNLVQTFQFMLPYGAVRVKKLEVVKPDGRIATIDIDSQSKIMIDDSQMSLNIYDPNMKTLRVGVPGLEVGDVLHYITRRDIVKARVPGTWSEMQIFEYTAPILHYLFEVNAPKDRPLKSIALKDPVKGTVKSSVRKEDDRIIYRWEAKDVPRMFQEPDMPELGSVVQRLLVSTVPSWEDISKWYWELSAPRLESVTPEMKEKVVALTKGLSEEKDIIEAVFYWVAQKVRYLGITVEKDAPGYEPHEVSMTFEKRHGVCRDKAALLVAMLRLAGLKAFPVMFKKGPKMDAEVPHPYFNHAVVAVENSEGSYILMDPTDENSKELFPAYLNNQSYVVARPEGDKLRLSPLVPVEENLVHVETTGSIAASGTLTGKTSMKFEGINDSMYRGYLARLSDKKRRVFFEGLLKNVIAGAKITDYNLSPANLTDTSQPLQLELSFLARDILVEKSGTVMLAVPRFSSRAGMVNFLLGKTGLKKRKYPLVTEYACGVREKLSLSLDPALGRPVAVPDFPVIDDKTIHWKRSYQVLDGRLLGENEASIKVVEFSPEEYLELKKHLETFEYNAKKMFILQTPQAGQKAADASVLKEVIEYRLKDPHTWTERHYLKKKILSYKGKKDNAEWVIEYNEGWQTVRLLKAQVKNGSTVSKLSEEEKNIMDAGWVAAAPRYPASRNLVVNLPGVEVGSEIEIEYEILNTNRPFFSMTELFQAFDPLNYKEVRLTAPKNLDLKVFRDGNGVFVPDEGKSSSVIRESKSRMGGKRKYIWTVNDMPAVQEELNLPPVFSFMPVVRVTTGNWRDYSDQVNQAIERAAQDQKLSAERALSLIAGADKERSKVKKIRDFVAMNIRRVGPYFNELPLSEISPADRTLKDGYGNDADRGVLLYAMLKEAGLDPSITLVAAVPEIPSFQEYRQDYPSLLMFPRMLVDVGLDGERIYLNDTGQYAELGSSPSKNKLTLNIKTGRVETAEISPEKSDRTEYSFKIKLKENGDAVIEVDTKTYGLTFASRKKLFSEITPENLDRYYQETVAEIAQSARAIGKLKTNYENYPGSESFSVKVSRLAVRSGDFLYLLLPDSFNHFPSLHSDQHKKPFYLPRFQNSKVYAEIELPKSFRKIVITPDSKTWDLPGGAGAVQFRIELPEDSSSRLLKVFYDYDLKPAIISANHYPDLLEISSFLKHKAAKTYLFSRGK